MPTTPWPYPDPDRLLGCLLGGAIGDALGAPIEGVPLDAIRSRYGPDGLADYSPGRGTRGSITDDTQLTMFTAQALVQASVRARAKGIGGATAGLLQAGYLTWLTGQDEDVPPQPFTAGGWLSSEPALTTRRGPGRSTLAALHKAAERRRPGHPLGTPTEPINDSKGCGGVMRVAPCGFAATDFAAAFELGCTAAALTHGHPSGHLPAGVQAAIVWGLVRGLGFAESLERAREELRTRAGHEETSAAVDAALRLAAEGPFTAERLETLGTGYTGETALAIALYVMLHAERDATRGTAAEVALPRSVNHSGDSDSTGAVAGNLIGARFGAAAFPTRWREGLEVTHAIERMADDCAQEFGPTPPTRPGGYGEPPLEWVARYPDA